MISSIFVLTILVCLYFMHRSMKGRISQCEERLVSLEKRLGVEKQVGEPAIGRGLSETVQSLKETKFEVGPRENDMKRVEHTKKTKQTQKKTRSQVQKKIQIPTFIKDNWLAAIGSIACVIGAVFFGITSGLLSHPLIRLTVILAFSGLLVVLGAKLGESWRVTKSLLRSTAGAIVLFSAVGAGQIEGLRCVHSMTGSLALLCMGIAVNLYFAMTTPFQMMASVHVLLSLIAFCAAPQMVLFLPVATLMALMGIFLSYRSKWDLHLILITGGFATYNAVWTWSLHLGTWMHYLAIFCALLVGLAAAAIHYRKAYQLLKLEALALAAHCTNWLLLAWNLYLHTQGVRFSFFILSCAAMAGFFLARVAKKKGIVWLYRTDTCFSQIIALIAIGALHKYSIKPLDICILALCQILIFNFIHHVFKESFLVRIGYFIQIALFISFCGYALSEIFAHPSSNKQLFLYVRSGVVVGLIWIFYIYGMKKAFFLDSFNFLILGDEGRKNRCSVTIVFSAIFISIIYCAGSNVLWIQYAIPIVLCLLSLWRVKNEDLSSNLSFLIIWSFCHIYSWILLFYQGDLGFRVDFLSFIGIDLLLVCNSMLRFFRLKKEFYSVVIYALAIQIALVTYAYSRMVSLYIPPFAFLGYALIILEVARYVTSKSRFEETVRSAVLSSLLHVGIGFVSVFLYKFITVYLQLEVDWRGMSLRIISELLGCGTFCYWIVYGPKAFPITKKNDVFNKVFVELLLGFVTLAVFMEVPDLWRPLCWIAIALVLVVNTRYFQWSNRLYSWSWGYLLASIGHVAFITGYVMLSESSVAKNHWILPFCAISLQLVFAFIVHKEKWRSSATTHSGLPSRLKAFQDFLYWHPTLTILLPIFFGVALFFAFNYEKTLLTLFWVGLSCSYLAFSLLAKSKGGMRVAMIALILCSIRLLIFDLMQSNLALRAIVFLGVGVFMLLVSMMYKKYKHRIEAL